MASLSIQSPPKVVSNTPDFESLLGLVAVKHKVCFATHTQNPPKLRELISSLIGSLGQPPTTVGTLPGAPSFAFLPKIAQLCSHYSVLQTNYLTINQISSEYRQTETHYGVGVYRIWYDERRCMMADSSGGTARELAWEEEETETW